MVATTAEMRALEQGAVDAGATWSGLMEQAGWGVAQELIHRLGNVAGSAVVVLVGPGNNGGDGLVIARHLHQAGARVTLYLWRRDPAKLDQNWELCRQLGISERHASDDADRDILRALLHTADAVVDALLGLGTTREVSGELAEIITIANEDRRADLHRLAVDLPTGIHSDTGAVLGLAFRADVTVATGALKPGLLLYPGRAYAGTLALAEIGLTQTQLEALMSEQITANDVRELLPARPDDSHKGTYGKAMIVAGSALYPGAASLASAAALRVGAGLVTLATGRSSLGGPGRLPEITLRPLPEVEWGTIGEEAATELLKHIEGYSALLVGPGLGQEEPTKRFVERLFGVDTPKQRSNIGFRVGASQTKAAEAEQHQLPPTVLDADALNILSKIDGWPERLARGQFVLTPHPGEMKRLLGAETLDSDVVQVATNAAKKWGQIVVLKGSTTVVADPEGRSAVHAGGNAALATAGTGDVLSGAIAGLLAQGLTPFQAAVGGVYLHSAAGKLLRDELGDAGTIASDLLMRLPLAIKNIKK